MQLVVNDLLAGKQEVDKTERVVWIDNENGWGYLVNINKPSFPYRLEINHIVQLLKTGELEKVTEDPWYLLVNEEDLTDAEIRKRDFAWNVIQDVYRVPEIFDPKRRSELIKQASIKFDISQKTIRSYLKQYWSRGIISKNSLLPNYLNSGKKQAGERVYAKKTGRPPLHSSSIERTNVGEEWKTIFRIVLEKHYFKRSKPSLKYAYQQMIKDYFSINSKDSTSKMLNVDKPIPSLGQFYYFYRSHYKVDYVIRKREGKRTYLQNHRAITGSANEDSMGIGIFAVDGTVGDIYLVSSIDRTKVIGRPIIMLIIDIYSRLITGVGVGIESMSSNTLRISLANTFENKKEFCKRTLDMDIDEKDWMAHYLPHTLLADRGSELISDDLTDIVEDLNIKIQNTAPWRPELKGTCESYFQILQNFLKPYLPGFVQKDFKKRGGQDYRKSAVLTLKEYFSILVECILYFNSRYMPDYPRSKGMIEESIPPIPNEIFKWGLAKGSGKLRTIPSVVAVYPKSKALVTKKGILFKGIYYSCPTAVKEGWFSTARINGNWNIGIRYDPQIMNKIYIKKDRTDYEVCLLIEQYDLYRTASLEEVVELQRTNHQEEVDYEEKDLNASIKLAQKVEGIVKRAKEEAKLESMDGRISKNVKDIRQNRKEEQELLWFTDVRGKGKRSFQNEETYGPLNDKQVKSLDIFRKKQKEGLDLEQD
ncbi:transposase family protein [Neobacillus niacini]|uniref:transposase family protein n=1 Tax=Neobacillus niacini TaxID=86668 RepID=UPI002FFECF1B